MEEKGINAITWHVIRSIEYNKKQNYYRTAIDVKDMKRLFWEYFKPILSENEKDKFVQGAKYIQFDVLFKFFKR
jgi:hypothetical protein